MIGNDIVDLQCARKESNWQRKGFLEKQFTDLEQEIIFRVENSFETVWRLWSMKEAAYKVFMQKHNLPFYAPKKFNCEITSIREGIVYFEDQTFFTKSIINRCFIFTYATTEQSINGFSEIGSAKNIEDSIKKHIEQHTNSLFSKIKQKKSISGAPNYYDDNIKLTKSCSISHHGNYGAFSLLYN